MKRRGVTIIELIVAMVVAGIIAAIFGAVIAGGFNSWFFIKGQKALTRDASSAMRRMVREIRRTNGSSITVFTSAEYRFIDLNTNVIDYQQSGTNLSRNGAVLLADLAPGGLQFTYLTTTGATAATAAAIKIVNIQLIAESGQNRVRLFNAAGIRNK